MSPNNLQNLNDMLFNAISKLDDPEDMTKDDVEFEIKKDKMISKLGETIIHNANTIISASDRLGLPRKDPQNPINKLLGVNPDLEKGDEYGNWSKD